MHHHLYRQSKARRDILLPQYHHILRQPEADRHDHHNLCHVQQDMHCSRDNLHLHLNNSESDTIELQPYRLRQAPSAKETVHCYFCPHFRGQEPCLKMNNIESDPRVHHKTCYHNRDKSRSIQLPPRSRSSDSSEDEQYRYDTGHHPVQGIHSNERQRHPPPAKHFHPKSSNDLFDRVHRHAEPPARSTSARATVYKSHEKGCGSNIKAVRFEEDGKTPEYGETHRSNCPLYHTPSHLEDQYYSRRNSHQNEPQSRESRTYRWVWGPPLPAAVPRRGKIY
ncbi:unnamed protein product [Penicillium egyptiacum]|uniref:Uncharacterized protein n=1 Tax=Penicillium egyptiacum TaxID=1303716 RepID=A0A9W4KRF7_9EURO|nr:unnamed protein product [Penicillium egyptiacum]